MFIKIGNLFVGFFLFLFMDKWQKDFLFIYFYLFYFILEIVILVQN